MGSGDKNIRTGWHHYGYHGRDRRDGSYIQYSSVRTNQSSLLDRHRIQDNRRHIQKSETRNNRVPHRASQTTISNRPSHHFLLKSKRLEDYLLTSLKSQYERMEESLLDDEFRGDHSDNCPHILGEKEDMDWQLEREIVVNEYAWSSEGLPASRSDEKLEITTTQNGHENPCRGGITQIAFSLDFFFWGVGWEGQKHAVATEIVKSHTGLSLPLSQLTL